MGGNISKLSIFKGVISKLYNLNNTATKSQTAQLKVGTELELTFI